ncbi:MAG: hypothetical protein C5B50_13585 [Verrucomicrobia bacterium]|nr:MAG: hypothetical protein C5B50_13585 [Verrucomicrobiota bacterium]
MKLAIFVAKALCLAIPTFIAVYLLGTILLTGLFGVLTGTPYLVFSRDLSGIPVIWYALGVGSRLASVASGSIWLFATLFAGFGRPHKSFLKWLLAMLIIGILVGAFCAFPVLAAGASELTNSERPGTVAAYVLVFSFVGAMVGTILSPLWYFAYQAWLSP